MANLATNDNILDSDSEAENEGIERVEAWWVPKSKSTIMKERQEEEKTSILLKFLTRQKQYSIPQTPIAVKENLGSEGLNELLKSILSRDDTLEEVPTFEFMVNGVILVSTIGELLRELDQSYELVADVEYFERHPPPTPKDNLEHDDWVSSVMNSEKWLLTGCYDNTIQLWKSDSLKVGMGRQAHILTIPAHKAPVKAVAWLDLKSDLKRFVSCSIDQSAMVWQWNSETNTVECIWNCRGHTQSVECLDANSTLNFFATGSWDTSIKIWDATLKDDSEDTWYDDGNEETEIKRKRTKREKMKTPLMTLAGHSESVSGIGWVDKDTLFSCSWDHSIRLWDVSLGQKLRQFSGNVAFFSLSFSQLNRTVIAGCADKYIRLYDPRITEGSVVQSKFGNHTKWVPSVRWSPVDENLFVSGSYDNSIRVWDRRSPKASLYNIWGHSDKVLSVDWSVPSNIASGSADNSAQLFTTLNRPSLSEENCA